MSSRTILVTGANRSIGFAIVHRLGKREPNNTYILGVRSRNTGQDAVRQLRDLEVTADIQVLELDVTDDDQVRNSVDKVKARFGKLDVLINNAAIANIPLPGCSGKELRALYNDHFDTNITSVAMLTAAFIPLLRRSSDPRVINISSGRASMHALTTGLQPATVSVPYSVSKLAMNVLMLEMSKAEEDVSANKGSKILYQAVNPGHCNTALNGFKGKRDPFEGVKVVEELVHCKRETYPTGFWVWEGDEKNGRLERVPW